MRQPRLQRQIGNSQNEQDKKGADSHCPRETDLGNQIADHDGEDNTAQTGSRGCDAECKRTTLCEPGADRVDRGVEDCACADGAADSLGEDKLVVLGREGGHHQAEDVEEGAKEQDPAGAIAVEEGSEDWALCGC
jgi:hypothetical protein